MEGPPTKHGREALKVITATLAPLGFSLGLDTYTRHHAIVATRAGRRHVFLYHKGGKSNDGHIPNYARQWARRVLAEEGIQA